MVRLLAAGLLGIALSGGARAQEPVLVFAAASLKNALDDVHAAFQARTGMRAVASYAASSALARQIEAGAPADVFVSADLDWMDYVEKKNLLRKDSRRNLLSNRLVLVAPAASPVRATIEPGFPLAGLLGTRGRLALADPQHVPAGKYARAALEKLGVWDSVTGRLAAAENVRAALAFVARGEAPLGIVYETDAIAEPRTRVVAAFAAGLHPPVIYPAALTRRSGAGATAYLAFLAGTQSRDLFTRHGFAPGS